MDPVTMQREIAMLLPRFMGVFGIKKDRLKRSPSALNARFNLPNSGVNHE
jgi:hypothetical protein